jgi:multiple sugar transport system permease protein
MAARFIFAFASSWNVYIASMTVVRTDRRFTLPIAVDLFVAQLEVSGSVIQSACALPRLLLLLLGPKFLIKAFGFGSLAD